MMTPTLPAPAVRDSSADHALAGIRVVDFTQFISGPFATLILADFGADVIKIENPAGGDEMRHLPPKVGGDGSIFLWANRNKRSLALDLKQASARRIALELIAQADVMIENFSPGVMARLGLDYASLAASNPRLIYCSVSGFGSDGPFSGRAGLDQIAQAEAGLMDVSGDAGDPRYVIGTPVVDIASGMMASNAILAALLARARTGRGQRIEVALFDQAIALLGHHAMTYLINGSMKPRTGNASPVAAPIGVFHAGDGPVFLCCPNDRTFERLVCIALERPDLLEDADFATNAARVEHSGRLRDALEGAMAGRTRDHWLDRMRSTGVPVGRVATVAEALTGPEVAERGLVYAMPRVGGAVPGIALPIRMSDTPLAQPRPPAFLGEDGAGILHDVLGYDLAEIDELVSAGVIGARRSDGEA